MDDFCSALKVRLKRDSGGWKHGARGVYLLRRGKIGFSGPSWCFSHPSMKGQTQITPFLIWFWNIFRVILGHSWQWLKNIYHFIVVGVCTFRQFQQNAPSQNWGNDTSLTELTANAKLEKKLEASLYFIAKFENTLSKAALLKKWHLQEILLIKMSQKWSHDPLISALVSLRQQAVCELCESSRA